VVDKYNIDKMSSNILMKVPNPKTLMMYRRMLKSMQTVFHGDYEMFHKARIEMRRSIEAQSEERDPAKVAELLFQYEETRRILLQGVVQGNLQEDGTYRWKIRKEHAMGAAVKD